VETYAGRRSPGWQWREVRKPITYLMRVPREASAYPKE
jgi:hypothetical protein